MGFSVVHMLWRLEAHDPSPNVLDVGLCSGDRWDLAAYAISYAYALVLKVKFVWIVVHLLAPLLCP
jgi:hypothetical protein